MDVQSQVMAGAVGHPAAVVLAGLGQGHVRRDRQQPPLLEPQGEHVHGCGVDIAKLVAGYGDLEGGVGGVEHGLVNPALDVRVAAVHRQSAREVRGVERLGLHTRVHQDHLTGLDRPVVADPVQHRGVVARRRNGVVAQIVAFQSGAGKERPLDHTFAALAANGAGKHRDNVLEPANRGVHGLAQLADLVVVLHETQFAQGLRELGVLGVGLFQVHTGVQA